MRVTGNILTALIIAAVAFGCAKKADTSKTIEQIQQEVQNMNLSQLESTAKAYVSEIKGKQGELDKVKQELSTLSAKDLFSEKAGQIKDKVSAIGNDISALTQRYEVYVNKYRELGGDLSKVQI